MKDLISKPLQSLFLLDRDYNNWLMNTARWLFVGFLFVWCLLVIVGSLISQNIVLIFAGILASLFYIGMYRLMFFIVSKINGLSVVKDNPATE